jgi:hypothetical protein
MLGNLLGRHTGKKTHLDDISLTRIEAPETVKSFIEREDSYLAQCEVGIMQGGGRDALGGAIRPSPVNQYLPHDAGGDAKKMRPIGDTDFTILHETEEGLVDQSGGLEGLSWPLSPQVTSCDTAQFGVRRRQVLVNFHSTHP